MQELCCCFSGHRPEKVPFELSVGCAGFDEMMVVLEAAVRTAVQDGYTGFYTGMAQGWDILCGETVLKLKESFPHIRLYAVTPSRRQTAKWDEEWKARHAELLDQCDEVICVSDLPDKKGNPYLFRNRYMVDHSRRLICYLLPSEGKKGGTAYTVQYAKKIPGYEIVNLAETKPSCLSD